MSLLLLKWFAQHLVVTKLVKGECKGNAICTYISVLIGKICVNRGVQTPALTGSPTGSVSNCNLQVYVKFNVINGLIRLS